MVHQGGFVVATIMFGETNIAIENLSCFNRRMLQYNTHAASIPWDWLVHLPIHWSHGFRLPEAPSVKGGGQYKVAAPKPSYDMGWNNLWCKWPKNKWVSLGWKKNFLDLHPQKFSILKTKVSKGISSFWLHGCKGWRFFHVLTMKGCSCFAVII